MGEIIHQDTGREIDRRVNVDHAIEAWTTYLASEDYADATQETYSRALARFRSWLKVRGLDLDQVSPQDVQTWRDELRDSYSLQSINLWLSSIRRFYAWLIEEGAPILNPADVKGVRRRATSRRHKRDELTSSEVLAVLASCEDTPTGHRDRAILSLMAYCALRAIEVQRANLEDLQTKDDRTVLWVQGKGDADTSDFVVLPTSTDGVMRQWLKIRGEDPGPLFPSLGGKNQGQRISLRHIRRIVKNRYKEVGILNGRKTTHSLRHSAITSAIRHGATPLQVQAMARHKSFDTTLGYYHEVGRTENPAEDLVGYNNGDKE